MYATSQEHDTYQYYCSLIVLLPCGVRLEEKCHPRFASCAVYIGSYVKLCTIGGSIQAKVNKILGVGCFGRAMA